MVRDYTKWDDMPASLNHFAESGVRAYKIATTPPYGPVVIVADAVLQEEGIAEAERGRLRVPKLSPTAPPAADAGAIGELAKMLVAAESPAIVAGRVARTPAGLSHLTELAELLQAPVHDGQFMLRMNFPTRHALKNAGSVTDADFILALEKPDLFMVTHQLTPVNRFGMEARRVTKAGAKIVTISSQDLSTRNNYQDSGRYNEADLAIAADAEATLPALVEACRRLITADRKRAIEQRFRVVPGKILDRKAGDASLHGAGDIDADLVRLVRKAVFEVGINRDIDRRADRGEMIADVIDGDAVVGLADGPGKPGAGRGQRLEAEMLQGLRAADIKGIGDDEASALVQFPERGAFVSRCQHGLTPLNVCLRRVDSGATPVPPDASRHDLAQERPFFGEDELVLLGEIEIGHAFAVGAQPRPVAFIGR
jgi:hypothetical protein